MSPLSWPVALGTAVVGSPAVYAALGSETLSVDVALTRVLLCALGVWAVCSAVVSLAGRAVVPDEARVRADEPPADSDVASRRHDAA